MAESKNERGERKKKRQKGREAGKDEEAGGTRKKRRDKRIQSVGEMMGIKREMGAGKSWAKLNVAECIIRDKWTLIPDRSGWFCVEAAAAMPST